jgi:hypothetical protein
MADTSKIEDVQERKKLKRAARKKAAPKGPRVGARGENKQKLKKAARGQSKRNGEELYPGKPTAIPQVPAALSQID